MAKTLEELKAQASEAAVKTNGGVVKTVDTLTYKKGSGIEAVMVAMERAKAPLSKKVVLERALKVNDSKESRIDTCLTWLSGKKIVLKDKDGNYVLAPKSEKPVEEAVAEEEAAVEEKAVEDQKAA